MSEPVQQHFEHRNILVITNPTAGNGMSKDMRHEMYDASRLMNSWGNTVDVVETTAPDHATELALDALSYDIDSIVVVGGDGTIREVVEATADTEVAIGTFPTGLFNLWAREMKIPKNMEKAAHLLRTSNIRTVDVGQINQKKFFQFANMGFDSEEYMKVHRPDSVRKRSGGVTFAQVFAHCLKDGLFYRGHKAEMTLNGVTQEMDNMLIGVISNSRKYGLLNLNEETLLDDGEMEATFFTGKWSPQFLVQFAEIIARKENIKGLVRGAFDSRNNLVIQSDDKIGITIDGNPYEYADRVEVSMLPAAQKVFVPQRAPQILFQSK